MQIDVNRLKGKTVELGLTGAACRKTRYEPSTYYRKLGAGGGSFTIAQAQMISKILELSPNECSTIFFGSKLA
ncbi:MAG: XRE family transcriptional regulator [Oscillospiraceae bacterium]